MFVSFFLRQNSAVIINKELTGIGYANDNIISLLKT
jgi:hypothetical protein